VPLNQANVSSLGPYLVARAGSSAPLNTDQYGLQLSVTNTIVTPQSPIPATNIAGIYNDKKSYPNNNYNRYEKWIEKRFSGDHQFRNAAGFAKLRS
jgi:hypothetical protein